MRILLLALCLGGCVTPQKVTCVWDVETGTLYCIPERPGIPAEPSANLIPADVAK